jgi:hypothetical protein
MIQKQFPGFQRYDRSREQAITRQIILFCTILLSGGNLIIPRGLLAALSILLTMVYLRGSSDTRGIQRKFAYIWLGVVILLSLRQTETADLMATFTRIANFIVALALLHIYAEEGRENLMTDLTKVITPMTIQAVLTVVFAFVLPNYFMFVDTPEASFSTFLGVFNFHDVGGSDLLFVRPDGFFFEPGVFQIYLNILLFILLERKRSWLSIFTAILALICLQSTTGFLILGLQLLYFSMKGVSLHKSGLKGAVRFAVIALVAVGILPFMQSNIEAKLFGNNASSANARQFDLIAGSMVIAEHPLLGIGFNHDTYLDISTNYGSDNSKLDADDQHTGRYTSNGILMAIYTIGIPLGFVYLLGLVRQELMPHRLLFGMILFLALSTESLVFTPFFASFALRGLSFKMPERRSFVKAA